MEIRPDVKSKHYKPIGTDKQSNPEIDQMILDLTKPRPSEIKNVVERYIDVETGELWVLTRSSKGWVSLGDPISNLKSLIKLRARDAESKKNKVDMRLKENKIKKVEETFKLEKEQVVLEENNFSWEKSEPAVIDLKYKYPDINMVDHESKNYILIDITPSPKFGFKFKFDFVDYLSRYFVGSTVFLMGDRKKYTTDHFRKVRPNVVWLTDKTNDEKFSFIAFSRRYYTFQTNYLYEALKIGVESITQFIERGDDPIPGTDVCVVKGDIDLNTIIENKGNILTLSQI